MKNGKHNESICWYCLKSSGGYGCPLVDQFPQKIPKGCKTITVNNAIQLKRVVECPDYIPDENMEMKEQQDIIKREGVSFPKKNLIPRIKHNYGNPHHSNHGMPIPNSSRELSNYQNEGIYNISF